MKNELRRIASPYPPLLLLVMALACGLSMAAGSGSGSSAAPRAVPEVDTEAGAEGGEPGSGYAYDMSWLEVDRLQGEDKYAAAAEIVSEILATAIADGDEEQWTRALVRVVQLRTALHGYETAVRTLHDTPWPTDPIDRTVVELFYAHGLITYLRAYGWEIGQRELVEAANEVDLERWTREEIVAESQRVLSEIWGRRGTWGSAGIDRLAAYLHQNNYPARIRGTLRDAVTYLWVELLADSSLWRPEHSNEIYRLDREFLIEPGAAAALLPALADPNLHPLLALAGILDDLERWHAENDRPEAAFAARLERLERLHAALELEEDRSRIRAAVMSATEALGQRFAWWSMGQAILAEQVQQEGAADALIRARDIALAGAAAHPTSIGGQRCRHLVAAIEAPHFDLTAMQNDGVERRSILIRHKNLPTLFLRAYRLDLLAQIGSSRDYNLLPGYREVPEIIARQLPEAEWSLELPPTPDYRAHQTFAIPQVTAPGLYIVVASAERTFRPSHNRIVAVSLVIGDLVLLTRQSGTEFEVEVRSGESGRELGGVEVLLYRFDYRRGHRRVASQWTAADGRVRFTGAGRPQDRYFLVARRGEELAIDPSTLWNLPRPDETARSAALIYTDRSIYRPQQQIQWKVVAYRLAAAGRGMVLADETLRIELRDANYQVVDSAEVHTNSFGSASGVFDVPIGRLLGQWQVHSSLGGSTPVEVEEYKRPTFEAEIEEPEEALRLNRPAVLRGTAGYYFGLPVVEGEIEWQVERVPLWPHWWWYRAAPDMRSQVIAAGTTTTDAEGRFELSFLPEADERLATETAITYSFRLRVDVIDDGGETRSAERVFRLGFVAVQAAIEAEASFFDSDSPISLSIRRIDLDGVPRPGSGNWSLHAIEQPAVVLLPADQPLASAAEQPFATAGDRQRPRWDTDYEAGRLIEGWKTGGKITGGRLEHDQEGLATVELGSLPGGVYRLGYSTRDDFGALFETSRDIVVANGGPLALPFVFEVERGTVEVGDTARLLIGSGFPEQQMVLEVFHRGQASLRRVLTSDVGGEVVEIPVGEDDRGGFSVRLTALRDHQLMTSTRTVHVPWQDRRLQVGFTSFRDLLRPGARETWRVEVRDWRGEELGAGAAEVLAYMYDRSLDIFAPHQPPQIEMIYPSFMGATTLKSSLGVGGEIWSDGSGFGRLPGYPHLVGDQLIFFDGYGIGGPGRRFREKDIGMAEMAVRSDAAVPDPTPPAAVAASEAGPQETGIGGGGEPESAPPVRSDFSETAFWQPHLLLGADGTVAFEFTVPDSVTDWNVWAHAVSRELEGGSVQLSSRSVKDLMVRPYLPRFLREGDRARLRVVVNNASDEAMTGTLALDIRDRLTDSSLLAAFGIDRGSRSMPFSVGPQGSTTVLFDLVTPPLPGEVAVEVVARAGNWTDGELRALPVLPGRMHLSQSRFAALRGADRRTLEFADMAAADDPTLIHDQLVVTLDAQLFYGVLQALPYLVSYPYECTEQTLNRFLSTGIVSALYDEYPEVARMAKEFSARETRLETWDTVDANRKMALVETPWLQAARGGESDEDLLINVLDPRIAGAERRAALAKLDRSQTASGGFPWWPGGPPSPYMTLYLLQGFSRALEFDIEIPREMVVRAWRYLHRHWIDELVDRLIANDCCWEMVTFLHHVLSSYPDETWTDGVFSAADRLQMLDFSFRHWRRHSPLLKSYLALTLARSGRIEDADLVFESVMDSSRTGRDEGTYWAPEDRAWLWYNDTIETHAFALRTLTEIAPDDERRHGLVQWLFLNRKLNHWKSTRATAEVIYALVHYLDREGGLGQREAATVHLGDRSRSFVWEPDRYTGRGNQWITAGPELDPSTDAGIVVEKSTPGLLFASATWQFSTEKLPAAASGDFFTVERSFFRRLPTAEGWVLRPLAEGERLEVGDQVEVQLSLKARHAAEYVHLRDPRGAGFEPVSTTSGYRWNLGISWYEEVRDSGTDFFFDWLPVGEYTLKYRLRVAMSGTFRVAPAVLQSMYAPEFSAYSAGEQIRVD